MPILDGTYIGGLGECVHSMLREHLINGSVLLPGVGYIELACAAEAGRLPEITTLQDLSFVRPCVILGAHGSDACTMHHSLDSSGVFSIASLQFEAQGTFVTHATGKRI